MCRHLTNGITMYIVRSFPVSIARVSVLSYLGVKSAWGVKFAICEIPGATPPGSKPGSPSNGNKFTSFCNMSTIVDTSTKGLTLPVPESMIEALSNMKDIYGRHCTQQGIAVDTARSIKCAIASMSRDLNWRASALVVVRVPPMELSARPGKIADTLVRLGTAVAERLTCSPTTKANRVHSPAGSPDFREWELCRTMPLVSGFSRGSTVSPPFHSRIAPYSPRSPSSALKISLLRAAQISSLTYQPKLQTTVQLCRTLSFGPLCH
ncbi:hypothetical protein PR048_022518 [Dryococelus australis]|uniref:Uncharacterized protein n=1 Tax=Dryococelus australis TaxID=614101 RepID=A0ABQ9H169_9NEOP|nr:hypothetical protein PR048_022518 [Dryococelus australis]